MGIFQGYNESLIKFPEFMYPFSIPLSISGGVTIGIIAFYLIYKRKLTKKRKILLLICSLIVGGIILGGVPNVVLGIQNIFSELRALSIAFFTIIIISLLLILGLFFGRIFCGYVCPLGALQELLSMVRFTSRSKSLKIRKKIKMILRWIFFTVYLVCTIIFGVELTLFMNPFLGFQIIRHPFNLMIQVALIFLLSITVASFFYYRPYCRWFCPFGALACELSKFSRIKYIRTESCLDCSLCEKICPTLEAFRDSKKGECYLCNRCVDFCDYESIVDKKILSQINRYVSTAILNFNNIPKEKFLDKIIKGIIGSIVPTQRKIYLNKLIDAIKGKKKFPIDYIQKIIVRLRIIYDDYFYSIDQQKYMKWIEQNNEICVRINFFEKNDKVIFGFTKSSNEL